MRNFRTDARNLPERFHDNFNEALRDANALVPWFDLPLFLKELVRSLCVYCIVRSGAFVSALVAIYFILSDNDKSAADFVSASYLKSGNPKSKMTTAQTYSFCVSFGVQYGFWLLLYHVPLPSLVFLTFVRTLLESYVYPSKFLEEKLLLEQIDDQRLSVMLQKLGTQVPSWLSTPDHQRVDWLNKIIKKLWPHIFCLLENKIEDFIYLLSPKMSLTIENLFPGTAAPRVSSVSVREHERGVFLDVSVTYGGDFSGCVKWLSGVEIEIDHVQIQADLVIELQDFVDETPFVRKLIVHMEKPPSINPRMRKMASALEAFKPVKKAFLDYIQNTVKSCFPYEKVLVAAVNTDVFFDNFLTESQNFARSRSGSKKSFSSPFTVLKNTSSIWDRMNTRNSTEEKLPNQILSYFQDSRNSRKRLSDPTLGGDLKQPHSRSTSPFQAKDSQKKSNSKNTNIRTKHIPFTQSDVTPKSTYEVNSTPLQTSTSFSQSQERKHDWYIGNPSFNSLNLGDDTSLDLPHIVTVTKSFETKGQYPEDGVSSNSSLTMNGELLISDLGSTLKYPDDASVKTENSSSSGASIEASPTTNTEVTFESRHEDIGAAIARDVELRKLALSENISTGITVDNDSVNSEEVLEPFTLVSPEGLNRMLDSNPGNGCVDITTRFQTPNKLIVVVHKMRNVPKKGGRLPNPYVKLHLQNQDLKLLKDISTEVLENTQYPVFDSLFEFLLEKPLSEYTLKISAKTKHKLAHHLGQVVLCFAPYRTSQVVKERNWFDLADPKKDHVMCWVGYKDTSSSGTPTTKTNLDDYLARLPLSGKESSDSEFMV